MIILYSIRNCLQQFQQILLLCTFFKFQAIFHSHIDRRLAEHACINSHSEKLPASHRQMIPVGRILRPIDEPSNRNLAQHLRSNIPKIFQLIYSTFKQTIFFDCRNDFPLILFRQHLWLKNLLEWTILFKFYIIINSKFL